MQYEIKERITFLVVTYVNADDVYEAESAVRMQGVMEFDDWLEVENQEIVSSREIGSPK